MASSLGDTSEQAEEEAAERLSDALPPLCTCTISTITLRRERAADYCPHHPRERVTFNSVAWERIPEQTLCICAHVKGVHAHNPRPNVFGCSHAIGEPGEDLRGCRCPDFHDVDHPMPLTAFMERLLHEVPRGFGYDAFTRKTASNPALRARLALGWAWKQSGLALAEPRTWALWMADSERVWRAWRDAGSPITAFGKETSFGVVEIPALEDR